MTHFFTSTDCLDHLVAPGHPERPERLAHLLATLQANVLWTALTHHDAPEADLGPISRVHDHSLLAELEAVSPPNDIVAVSADNHMSPGSLVAARRAVGAVLEAVDIVFESEDRQAFCAVRPPGHHAEEGAAMGFCFYNGIAVGADAALRRPDVERVAILDFDVHHGNGTVDIFRDRGEVLVCSSFQHPHYPNRLHDLPGDHLVYSSSTRRSLPARRAAASARRSNAIGYRPWRAINPTSSWSPRGSMPMKPIRWATSGSSRTTTSGSRN